MEVPLWEDWISVVTERFLVRAAQKQELHYQGISVVNEQLVPKSQSTNEWEDYLKSVSLRVGISSRMLG